MALMVWMVTELMELAVLKVTLLKEFQTRHFCGKLKFSMVRSAALAALTQQGAAEQPLLGQMAIQHDVDALVYSGFHLKTTCPLQQIPYWQVRQQQGLQLLHLPVPL